MNPPLSKANQRAKAEELFRKVDADGDGSVTAEELKKHAGYQDKKEEDTSRVRSVDLQSRAKIFIIISKEIFFYKIDLLFWKW